MITLEILFSLNKFAKIYFAKYLINLIIMSLKIKENNKKKLFNQVQC